MTKTMRVTVIQTVSFDLPAEALDMADTVEVAAVLWLEKCKAERMKLDNEETETEVRISGCDPMDDLSQSFEGRIYSDEVR